MLHVVGVDAAETSKVVAHDHTVNHIDRVGAGIDSVHTAHTDAGIVAGTCARLNEYTRYTTLQSLVDIGDRLLGEGLAIDTAYRTGKVALLHDCSDYHHFVKFRPVLHNGDIDRGRALHFHFLGDESDIGDCQLVTIIGLQLEISVKVSHHTIGCACDNHTGSDNRLARDILHVTGNNALRHNLATKAGEY